eukprot:2366937-Rhodomonas_salina.1
MDGVVDFQVPLPTFLRLSGPDRMYEAPYRPTPNDGVSGTDSAYAAPYLSTLSLVLRQCVSFFDRHHLQTPIAALGASQERVIFMFKNMSSVLDIVSVLLMLLCAALRLAAVRGPSWQQQEVEVLAVATVSCSSSSLSLSSFLSLALALALSLALPLPLALAFVLALLSCSLSLLLSLARSLAPPLSLSCPLSPALALSCSLATSSLARSLAR